MEDKAKKEITTLFEQAQNAYAKGDPSAALIYLQTADELLTQARQHVQETQSSFPTDLLELGIKVQELTQKTQLAKETAEVSLISSLRIIKLARERWPDDTTFQAIEENICNYIAEEVQTILIQADHALEIGNLSDAVDLIAEAFALEPENAEVRQRYTELKRCQQLEDRLLQVQTDYRTKMSTGSLPDAGRALRKGLEIFLEPEYGLPEEFQNALKELISSGNTLALWEDDQWFIMQEKLATLMRLSHIHPLASWAANMAYEWSDVVRDVALKGALSAYEQLGNLVTAYKLAIKLRERNPGDENAIMEEAKILETMLTQANSSAERRLGRAREALAHEDYVFALENLDVLENHVYGSIEGAFPNLLELYYEVDALRYEARRLRVEAEALRAIQPIFDRILRLFTESKQAFQAKRYAETYETLQSIFLLLDTKLPHQTSKRKANLIANIQNILAEK